MAIAERRQYESFRSAAIDELYVELHRLTEDSTVDPSDDPEIQGCIARLRALQSEEAEAMLKRLDDSLHLRPGAGYRALEEARRLLAEHAHPASEDPSTSR